MVAVAGAIRVPPNATAVGRLAILRATAQMRSNAIAAVVVHTPAEAGLATPAVVLGISLGAVYKAASVITAT